MVVKPLNCRVPIQEAFIAFRANELPEIKETLDHWPVGELLLIWGKEVGYLEASDQTDAAAAADMQ